MSFAFGPVLWILLLLLLLIPGVYLLITSRRHRRTGAEPRCGHCGYNLTASETNRCPECGQLFIEAGIVKGSPSRSRARVLGGLALILLPMAFAGLYLSSATRLQQARAIAAQQRALIAGQLAGVAKVKAEAERAKAETLKGDPDSTLPADQAQPTTAPTDDDADLPD